MILHTKSLLIRKQRVLLSIAALSIMTGAHAWPLVSTDSECLDGVSDNRFNSEICVQQDLDTQTLSLERIYQSLHDTLPVKEAENLVATQQQWRAFQSNHCSLLIHIAGDQNPAWQFTWGDVAMKSCEAELMTERIAQLTELKRLLDLKTQQTTAYPHNID
ncbi:DUF1311 domain-containing protein [Alcaligenes faecalis]|nr:DUF1311 domain-containing protein [Alcaligenes faecalis]